jgi:hypothetical protein
MYAAKGLVSQVNLAGHLRHNKRYVKWRIPLQKMMDLVKILECLHFRVFSQSREVAKGCAKTCSNTCSKVNIPIGCQQNFVSSAQGHYDLKLCHPIMTSYHDTRESESGHA